MKKTFREITDGIDMVLFNDIIKVDYELELEAWREFLLYNELYSEEGFKSSQSEGEIPKNLKYDDVTEEYVDIYQYFAINWNAGEYISKITDMPLYYSHKCNLYILWVNFLDNWKNMSYEV